MQLLEKVFTGIALVGFGYVGNAYYQKHYLKTVPKNYHLLVKDRRNNRYVTNDETVRLVPYWQNSELLRTKERYEIKSRASSKDKEVVNVHLLVESELKDVLLAYDRYGKDLDTTMRERLARQLKLACLDINSKTSSRSGMKNNLQKQLSRKISRPVGKNGVDMKIEVLDVVVSPPLMLRSMPELLI